MNREHSSEPPPLPFRNTSFTSFLGTQALGAFNDNLFKQIVLLLCVGYIAVGVELQAVVQLAFAVPFLLLSGLAGDLADRFSKGRLMVLCKVAEVGVMGTGVLVFASLGGDEAAGGEAPPWLWLLVALTFLMGSQSAFFGPPKYGGLPELVREHDLAPATGLTQMTTFLAIILGVAAAGFLLDVCGDRLWLVALPTVGIAVVGTLTSLGIDRVPAKAPDRRIGVRSLWSMIPTLVRIVRRDRLLFRVMLVYSWFWFVGGVSLPAINGLGRLQLGLDNADTSLLVSVLSVGIAAGSVTVGRLSRGKVRVGLVIPGLLGMVVCLLVLALVPVHAPTGDEIRLFNEAKLGGEAGGIPVIPPAPGTVRRVVFVILFLLGTSAGFLSVPLLAFVQARPAAREKGQVFAACNWLNWVFIVSAAVVYGVLMDRLEFRANLVMASLGAVTLVVGGLLVPRILRDVRRDRPEFVRMP